MVFFTIHEVARVTGFSRTQIDYAIAKGFVPICEQDIQAPGQARRYVLRDLVWMNVVAGLRAAGSAWSDLPEILGAAGLYDVNWVSGEELFPNEQEHRERWLRETPVCHFADRSAVFCVFHRGFSSFLRGSGSKLTHRQDEGFGATIAPLETVVSLLAGGEDGILLFNLDQLSRRVACMVRDD